MSFIEDYCSQKDSATKLLACNFSSLNFLRRWKKLNHIKRSFEEICFAPIYPRGHFKASLLIIWEKTYSKLYLYNYYYFYVGIDFFFFKRTVSSIHIMKIPNISTKFYLLIIFIFVLRLSSYLLRKTIEKATRFWREKKKTV
jgi:hypothetical protein